MEHNIDYKRHYEKWHSDTPEHIQSMKSFHQDMLSPFLPLDKNIRILDVGCGMGFAILALQDMGYIDVVGIDVDYGQVQFCLYKQLRVTQVDNSIECLRQTPNNYDLILCLDVIEHIPHEAQLNFVKAIQAALKPGGKHICTVPNANSVLASRWRYIDWTHYISFTEHSLDFLLFNAGFDDIKVFETEFFQAPQLRGLFSRSVLRKWFWKSILHWWLFRLFRTCRRLEMIAELGWKQGSAVPLSLNLLATSVKPL